MTMEPSDAETCLHVSISEANMSSPVRGMTRESRRGMTVKAAEAAIFYFKKSEIFPKSRIVMNTKKLMKNAAATFWITD